MRTPGASLTRGNASLLFLLPVFFVWHGFVENYPLVPLREAAGLAFFYCCIAFLLSLLAFPLFRDWRKRSLFALFLLAVHFFFGWTHDGLKRNLGDGFFTSYSFLLPLIAVFAAGVAVYLRKSSSGFSKAVRFIPLLLLVLIFFDLLVWMGRKPAPPLGSALSLRGLSACDTCKKPDVYLILADEYAGASALKEVFHFDNTPFLRSLEDLGFHVVSDSRSNYNFTPFSMASTLDMDYLDLKSVQHTGGDIPAIMSRIGDNHLTRYLFSQGYTIINNSVFDLPREPKRVTSSFLPNKTKYITAQTLLSRLDRDLFYHLIASLKLQSIIKKGVYSNLENNRVLYDRTIKASRTRGGPKFVYTHLSMPHPPFYFNSVGQPYSYEQLFDNSNRSMYLEYLKYSNGKLRVLVETILRNSAEPPVIFLLSDHGFREAAPAYQFVNLCAVYTPGKRYAPYYDSLSSVNLFRIFLREQFRQPLPLLKDSTVFLRD